MISVSLMLKLGNIKFVFSIVQYQKKCFIRITFPTGAYELESLNEGLEKNIIGECHFTEENYPIWIKQYFSTLASIVWISRTEPFIHFVQDDSIRNLLGFDPVVKYEKFELSPNPVDILSFDDIFLKTDIANGVFLEGNQQE